MTDDLKDRLLDEHIIEAVRSIEEKEPPAGFSARVMSGLKPKKLGLWRRFVLWLTEPKALTYRPLQVIPVATCVVALLALAYVQLAKPIHEDTVRLATVRFVLHDTDMQARKVSVIGSFNNWKAERSVMWFNHDANAWILEAQLPPGDHEYLFLVNGEQLVTDPNAAMTRDDGFGNKNSIVFVNGEYEQAL